MKKATKALLRQARELSRESGEREKAHLFIAEGSKVIRDISAKGHGVALLLASDTFLKKEGADALVTGLAGKGAEVYSTPMSEYRKASSLRNPEGIMAFVRIVSRSAALSPEHAGGFCVLCDGIQDPENIGAIIRSSVAFGSTCVMLTGTSADVYNPKAVRSSSGMVLDIPVIKASHAEIFAMLDRGYKLLASTPATGTSVPLKNIREVPDKAIVAFGSEGSGVSAELLQRADVRFSIPLSNLAESLNVNAAVAISLYYLDGLRGEHG